MDRLGGKVALVTGAGSGIGRETCIKMVREGAQVVAVDVRPIHDVVEGTTPFTADVSVASECEAMVAFAESSFGHLDVLFNNAGVMLDGDDDAVRTDEAIWDRTMAVNAKGVFLGCKFGIPALRRAGGGSIINTASFVAMMGAATPQLAYTASKGAVLSLTRELAVIHARENIRVNSLCPGPLRTELLMAFLDTEQKRDRRLVHIPMGRFGEATEIADAVVFLASGESSYITGADFVVDGGITCAYVTPQ